MPIRTKKPVTAKLKTAVSLLKKWGCTDDQAEGVYRILKAALGFGGLVSFLLLGILVLSLPLSAGEIACRDSIRGHLRKMLPPPKAGSLYIEDERDLFEGEGICLHLQFSGQITVGDYDKFSRVLNVADVLTSRVFRDRPATVPPTISAAGSSLGLASRQSGQDICFRSRQF
jgi:hypothetical protein